MLRVPPWDSGYGLGTAAPAEGDWAAAGAAARVAATAPMITARVVVRSRMSGSFRWCVVVVMAGMAGGPVGSVEVPTDTQPFEQLGTERGQHRGATVTRSVAGHVHDLSDRGALPAGLGPEHDHPVGE